MLHSGYLSAIVVVADSFLMILRYLHSMTVSECYFDGSEPKIFNADIEYPHQCLLLIISIDWPPISIMVVRGAAYLINAVSPLGNSFESK
jgi:hypothetical protein